MSKIEGTAEYWHDVAVKRGQLADKLESENISLSNRLNLAMNMLGEYVDNSEMIRRIKRISENVNNGSEQ